MIIPQLGYRAATTQRFWGGDTTTAGGVLGVLVNGVLTTGETLSANNGYTGIVDATVPDEAYTWQLTIGGVAVGSSYTAPAKPSATDNTKIVFWGDANANAVGFYNAAQEGAHLAVCLGDWDYIDSLVLTPFNLADYRTQHLTILKNERHRRTFIHSQPQINMWDNHEGVGSTGASPGSAQYDNARQAANEYFLGLVPVPAAAAGHGHYYSYSFGDIDFVCMDHISQCVDRNIVSENKMDATQLAWVQAAITASTGRVLVICSPSIPYNNPEWQALFPTINAVDKTVILLSADAHGVGCYYRPAGAHAQWFPDRGLLEVQATPLMHPTCSVVCGAGAQTTGEIIYAEDASESVNTLNCNYNYGTLEWCPSGDNRLAAAHLKVKVHNAWDGAVRWECVIREGSRVPEFLTNRMR